MKKYLLLALTNVALAQSPDTLKFGFDIEYDGNIIDHVGLRYNSNPDLAYVFTFMFSSISTEPSDLRFQYRQTGIAFNGTVGIEYDVYTVTSMSMFIKTGPSFGFSSYENWKLFNGVEDRSTVTRLSYGYHIGAGVRLSVTDRFSLSAHQSVSVSQMKQEEEFSQNSGSNWSTTETRFFVGSASATFTFHF